MRKKTKSDQLIAKRPKKISEDSKLITKRPNKISHV